MTERPGEANTPLPTTLPFPTHLAGFQTHLSPIDADAELDRLLATRPRILVIDRTRWGEIRPAVRIAALEREYRPVHEFVYRGGRIEVLERQ